MIDNDWDIILKDQYKKEYFLNLMTFINNEYKEKICYPEKKDIFKSLRYTSFEDLKVVIIGQDPYHGENEAEGLCFSVKEKVKRPPSLVNILKELENDLNIKRNINSLEDWAKQGVLLLNTVLTVEKDKPLSHKNKGWEIFTDEIIKEISKNKNKVIFILWGNQAKQKKRLIDKKHIIIESVHPSPLSCHRGFYGSKPFSKTNEILKELGKSPINW